MRQTTYDYLLTLVNITLAYHKSHDFKAELVYALRALSLCEKINLGASAIHAHCLKNAGLACHLNGEHKQELKLKLKLLEISQGLGNYVFFSTNRRVVFPLKTY